MFFVHSGNKVDYMKIKRVLIFPGILLLVSSLSAASLASTTFENILSVIEKISESPEKSEPPRVFSPLPEEIPLYVSSPPPSEQEWDSGKPLFFQDMLTTIRLAPEMLPRTRTNSLVTVRPEKDIAEKPGIWNDLSRQAETMGILSAGSRPLILGNRQAVTHLKLERLSILPNQDENQGISDEYLFEKEISFDIWKSLRPDENEIQSPLKDMEIEATDLLEYLNSSVSLTDTIFELYGPTPLLLCDEFFGGGSYEYIGWDIYTFYGKKGRLISMADYTPQEIPPFTAPEPKTWGLLLVGGIFIFVQYRFLRR